MKKQSQDQMFNFKQIENKKIKPNLWKLFSIPESKSNDFFSKTEIIFKEKENIWIPSEIIFSVQRKIKCFSEII